MASTWLAFLFLGAICFLIKDMPWFAEYTDAVSWGIILVVSTVFILSIARKYKDPAIITVIFFGYFLRIGLLVWDLYFYDVVRLFHSGADSEAFYRLALRLLEGSLSESGSYPTFLFRLFQLFGHQRVIAQYANLLISMTSVLVAYKILRKCRVDTSITITMLALGLFIPHYMMQNVILTREAIISFLVIVSLYFFVLWFKDNNFLGIIGAFGAVFAATFFHSGTVAVVAGYALCVVFFDRKHQAFRISANSVALAIVVGAIFFAAYNFWGDTILGDWAFDDAEQLADFLARDPRGGAGYAINIPTGNAYTDIIVNTPIRSIYFLLAPMPWDWRGVWDAAAFAFSSAFYGYFYYTTIKALPARGDENREMIILLLLASVASAIIFGWGVSNSGTALRHRDKFFFQHVLMFALSYNAIRIKHESPLDTLRRWVRMTQAEKIKP